MSPLENSKVTRMIILGPSANISQSELVRKLHMMELPLTIKSTCYGAAVSGEEDAVKKAIDGVRELDPYNIFSKDRGFPPGDPRRCRAKRGELGRVFINWRRNLNCLMLLVMLWSILKR